jgi:hypothetical protein
MSSAMSEYGHSERGRFSEAVSRFDRANAEDPNVEFVAGVSEAKELVYARRMSAWLAKLVPDASEPLRLAARCQHIRRWTIPRSQYQAGRDGYRAWRACLKNFHAETAGEILRDVGYDDPTISRVQAIVRKERLKADPAVQALEDVICLVFLEYYFEDFAAKHDKEKLLDILQKTWRKMSDHGRTAALALELKPELHAIVVSAVS